MAGDVTGSRWVTVTEAVGILGKSERTIRRWLAQERLPKRSEGRSILVDVSGELQAPRHDTPAIEPDTDRRGEVAELRLQVKMLAERAERAELQTEHWRLQAEAALVNQRLLLEAPKKRFRWPWERGEE